MSLNSAEGAYATEMDRGWPSVEDGERVLVEDDRGQFWCDWCGEAEEDCCCCESCGDEGFYEEWSGPHVRRLPCPDCQPEPESPVHPAVAMQVLACGGDI